MNKTQWTWVNNRFPNWELCDSSGDWEEESVWNGIKRKVVPDDDAQLG